MARLKPGVHNISATPFLPNGSLDLASLRTLLDFLIERGCNGALVLGVLGEADKLSDRERDEVLAATLDHAGDRLQISVGITHGSTVVARQRAQEAEAAGAMAVMISPPPGSAAGPALREHFLRIADGLSIPVIVQDHPASSGVKLPVEFIASLYDQLPPDSAVKLEDPPTARKMAALHAMQPGFQIFGGLGGVSLYQELLAGSDGAMTGFAIVDTLVEIVSAFLAGHRDRAYEAYAAALPMMVLEAQPGVALRKEILRRLGAIEHATVRQPAPALDPFTVSLIDDLLGRLPELSGVARAS